jgi:hypothetical protein
LSAVADPEATAAILERALAYPYATPDRSYLYLDGKARELPVGAGADFSARAPLLSYGANAAPDALARKLAALPGVEMPVMRSELEGFDVVYSAHISPYGAVPGTLLESPGTAAPVFVIYPTAEQRELLMASEPNYDLVEVNGFAAYRSKHGCLAIDGSPVALAAVWSAGRTLPALDEPAVLEHVRTHLAPALELGEFVRTCVEQGGVGPLPNPLVFDPASSE